MPEEIKDLLAEEAENFSDTPPVSPEKLANVEEDAEDIVLIEILL